MHGCPCLEMKKSSTRLTSWYLFEIPSKQFIRQQLVYSLVRMTVQGIDCYFFYRPVLEQIRHVDNSNCLGLEESSDLVRHVPGSRNINQVRVNHDDDLVAW